MITFQSGPQLGSLRPLEAGRAVFGKGSDQPPQVRMLHRHPPAHLLATAAGGGRGWAGQRSAGGGSRKQRALPLSERVSRGFDPPLTRHFELSLLLCSLLPSLALGFLWAPAATLCTAPNCIAPGPAPPLTTTTSAGSGKARTGVPCPAAHPDRCPEHFSRYVL